MPKVKPEVITIRLSPDARHFLGVISSAHPASAGWIEVYRDRPVRRPTDLFALRYETRFARY